MIQPFSIELHRLSRVLVENAYQVLPAGRLETLRLVQLPALLVKVLQSGQ